MLYACFWVAIAVREIDLDGRRAGARAHRVGGHDPGERVRAGEDDGRGDRGVLHPVHGVPS